MSEKKPYKILVVDDDLSIIESVSYILKDRGFCVIEAEDGDTAIFKARQYKPDLILLDINMPQKSGYCVASLLGNDIETNAIPIIFLTATSTIVGNNITLKSTHQRIEKPFSEDELVETIIDAISF